MAQQKTFTWTNANPAVARNQDIGFEVSRITTIDITNGGSWQWVKGMVDGSYLDVDAGTITGTNGFTPLEQDARYGAAISAFSNAANGVITATGIADFGFTAGDTIMVAAVADDGSGLSLNGTWTVSSVTATTITLNESTAAPTYSVYVSGGFATRVSDANGDPIPTENKAIRGMTIGTGVVGAASASMVGIAESQEPVT